MRELLVTGGTRAHPDVLQAPLTQRGGQGVAGRAADAALNDPLGNAEKAAHPAQTAAAGALVCGMAAVVVPAPGVGAELRESRH